jgi:hypothetical protein
VEESALMSIDAQRSPQTAGAGRARMRRKRGCDSASAKATKIRFRGGSEASGGGWGSSRDGRSGGVVSDDDALEGVRSEAVGVARQVALHEDRRRRLQRRRPRPGCSPRSRPLVPGRLFRLRDSHRWASLEQHCNVWLLAKRTVIRPSLVFGNLRLVIDASTPLPELRRAQPWKKGHRRHQTRYLHCCIRHRRIRRLRHSHSPWMQQRCRRALASRSWSRAAAPSSVGRQGRVQNRSRSPAPCRPTASR